MKAPRLHELTARVVAWHNRHPLARRIDATQVHSIGEVRLPFASAQPWGDAATAAPEAPPPPAHGPTLAEALALRNARQQAGTGTPGIDGLEVQSVLPEAALFDAAAAAAAPGAAPDIDLALDAPADHASTGAAATPADAGDGDTALVIPLLDGEDAAVETPDTHPAAAATPAPPPAAPDPPDPLPAPAPAPPDAVYPPPHGVVPESSLARAVERRAAARGAAGHAAVQPDSPPALPAGRWRRLVAALRRAFSGRQAGLPPLRAAFTREFIWPLRPGQVARWAQRHGQALPLAPADWPRRSIDTDRSRLAQLRQKGLAHDLPLHVLTAAIGVGDRRIRVLVGADGSILGPRAYHPQRMASACMVLAVGLVGLGWSLRPLHGVPGDAQAAALAALGASATASAPALAAPTPVVAASAPHSAASATLLALAASAADPAASQAQAGPEAAVPTEAKAAVAASTAADAASQPQANIRPALSDEDRDAARVEATRLRGEPLQAPPATLLPGPVYAVVGPASRQRAAAAGSLAKMKSAASRLDGPVPEHGELVESQGQWRATWWPFTSLVDAERARVLLAGQGIKAEVIEF